MQFKNKRNTCPEQYKMRWDLLVAKYGKSISISDVSRTDSSMAPYLVKKYGSWNNAKKSLGLKINNESDKKKESTLVYDLREYVKENHHLPWYTYSYGDHRSNETRNGFPHHVCTYTRRYGSRIKALLHCGIVKTDKWLHIDGKRLKWLEVLN